MAFVGMLFCFLAQNFAEIGHSIDELWPKQRFSRWRPPPSWILSNLIFDHVTVGFNICSKFHKNRTFFTEIWWFSDLQNGGRPPSWICYDITVLYRRTHFPCPTIVQKFHVDWFVVSEILATSYVAFLAVHNGSWQLLWGCACAVSHDP